MHSGNSSGSGSGSGSDSDSGTGSWPHPLGLSLGILSVVVGQILVVSYHYARRQAGWGTPLPIQLPKDSKAGAVAYDFWEGVRTHFFQPEGFVMLGSYLVVTWMFNMLPASYYSFEGGVSVVHLFCQLFCQDTMQTLMHLMEHKVSPTLYRETHKPHHRFTNPRLFDAFNGSAGDTFFMILVPLIITAHLVHCNVWSYMAFGTVYSSYLTLIHCEFSHPWDGLFRKIGFATAADHHVHHKLFTSNYGHLFTYWDRLAGTYKSPLDVKLFSKDC